MYIWRVPPLAVGREVEYELQRDGTPIGLFDIKNAGQEQGSWVGYGTWKPLPAAAIKGAAPISQEGADADSDRPVLHRKNNEGGAGADPNQGSAPAAPAIQTDRRFTRKPGGDAGDTSSDSAPDADKPTLHPKDSGGGSQAGRTTLIGQNCMARRKLPKPTPRKVHPRPLIQIVHSSSEANRAGTGLDVLPSFVGLPQEMYQAVAISDARSRPDHPWSYAWANSSDEPKMKAAMEEIARMALGLKSVPAASAQKRASVENQGQARAACSSTCAASR